MAWLLISVVLVVRLGRIQDLKVYDGIIYVAEHEFGKFALDTEKLNRLWNEETGKHPTYMK